MHYLSELKYRFYFVFYNFLLFFLVQWMYSEELLFLIGKCSFLWMNSSDDITFVQIHLSETFVALLKFSLIFSFLLTIPFMNYQLYLFGVSALFPEESNYLKSLVLLYLIFFLFSMIFSTSIVFPFYVFSSLEFSNLVLPMNDGGLVPFKISLRVDDILMQFVYCLLITCMLCVIFLWIFYNFYFKCIIHINMNRFSIYIKIALSTFILWWSGLLQAHCFSMLIVGFIILLEELFLISLLYINLKIFFTENESLKT